MGNNEHPVGLAGTDITLVKEGLLYFDFPHDGHVIVRVKDGKLDIQAYKIPAEKVAVVLREAAKDC
jgi:hypothetical protein